MKKLTLLILVFFNLQFATFAQTQDKPQLSESEIEKGIQLVENSQDPSCQSMGRIMRDLQSGKYDDMSTAKRQKLLPQELVFKCLDAISMKETGHTYSELSKKAVKQ